MNSIRVVSMVLGTLCVLPAAAAERPASREAELAALKAELKPLRQRATLEPDVLAAKKSLDAAYRAYWEAVRTAMLRLEPEKKAVIAKEIALRKNLSPLRGEPKPTTNEKTSSKKAAAQSSIVTPSPSPKKNPNP